MRTAMLVCTAALALMAPAALAQPLEETRHHSIPTVPNIPLKVTTNNGDIEIIRKDISELRITAVAKAKSKERLDQIKFSATSAPGVGSEVHVDFPEPARGESESCSLRIELPVANGVIATTANGGITCYGMSGVAEFNTANGAIVIEKHDGPVTATTSNGPVTVKLANAPTKIRTSNGFVTFTMVDAGFPPFDIETSNASVHVILGPSYTGVIDMATSNGKITFPKGAVVKKQDDASKGEGWGKASAIISHGAGTDLSRIRSSNGSIEVSLGLTAAEDAAGQPAPQPAPPPTPKTTPVPPGH